MKSKITKILIFAVIAIMLFGTFSASAFDAYDTYTYSIDGEPMMSPHAYTASSSLSFQDMKVDYAGTDEEGKMKIIQGAQDVVSDERGYIYLADKTNNSIVVLDAYYRHVKTISTYFDDRGQQKQLKEPEGVFVTPDRNLYDDTDDGRIYICDTGNKQIQVFDREYNYERTIYKPADRIIDADSFVPQAIAVDLYGRIFISSQQCFEGIIVLANDGSFTGFIGAQKVTYSILDRIWSMFQSEEQRKRTELNIPTAYNNVTVDEYGFVYATINFKEADDRDSQLSSIESKTATYSPVKKLNSMGKQIMKRNGFFDCGGEVGILSTALLSTIVDVAIGPAGSWTILDSNTQKIKRARTFTYNSNGELLFAFGDVGGQLGNCVNPKAITYQPVKVSEPVYDEQGGLLVPAEYEYRLLILDKGGQRGDELIVYSPTEYCNTIIDALENENEHKHSQSIECWQDVLTMNNNFDLAYIGIGKALYNQGNYEEAKEYLEVAYEVDFWAKAQNALSKDFTSKWMIPMVILVILVLVLFFKFLGWAKKKNKATALKVGRKTYAEELLYVFHLVFHPFDGFWDLKHEKRGSVRAATTFLAITVIAFFYQSVGQGYYFNPKGESTSILVQLAAVLVPVFLFIIANWCLTTLFDGEGSFKDIYIACCYAIAPLPLFVILSTILTNVMTGGSIVSLLVTFGYVWAALLLFFGMVVTHDYSIVKNIITILGTIVAMVVIMFVIILFSALVVKVVSFLITLVTEIVANLS